MERQAETAIEEILKNAVPIDCSQVYRICSYASNCMKSDNPNSGIYEAEVSATLDLNGGNPACNQGGMCIVERYVLNDQGGESINIEKDDISPTLRAQTHGHEPVVCYGFDTYNQETNSDLMYTLKDSSGGDSIAKIFIPVMLENHPNDSRIKIDDSGNCQTLTSRMGTGGGNVPLCMMPIATEDISYIVRRLTPRECAKLQGFPADWHEGITNAKGKTLPDSAAYKGYGNAVATVCAAYPIANIIKKLKEENSHGQEEYY